MIIGKPYSLENKTIISISIQIMIWGGIFLLVVGNIEVIGNILVFRSKTYRRQACFIYLFSETIASLFTLDCILLTSVYKMVVRYH